MTAHRRRYQCAGLRFSTVSVGLTLCIAARSSAGPAGGHQLVEKTAELSFIVHVAIRSPHDAELAVGGQPRPDPSSRPVETDRDAGDQQSEGEPDQTLAWVLLGDQQG